MPDGGGRDGPGSQLRPPIKFRGSEHRGRKGYVFGTHRGRSPAETYDLVKPFLREAGVTRIADVTGLDTIGVPTTLAFRPNALTIACSSGKGMTLDQAYVSGAMEALELHCAETALLTTYRASHAELARTHGVPDVDDLPLTRWSLFTASWPFEWYFGWDLVTQSEVAVPAACIGMSRHASLIASAGSFQVSSNGLGAGNSLLEAIASGLHECIERDAVACRLHMAFHAGDSVPVVPRDVLLSYATVGFLLDKCDAANVGICVRDCWHDTRVPTYYAIAYDRVNCGVPVVHGSGSHLDPEIAMTRAITEALQARLNFIAGSRDDIFRSAFSRFRMDWAREVAFVQAEEARASAAPPRSSRAGAAFEDDVTELIERLVSVGIKHVVVADLTPPAFPVTIVRVFVPGLEGYMHHGYRPGRRAQAAVSAGLHA